MKTYLIVIGIFIALLGVGVVFSATVPFPYSVIIGACVGSVAGWHIPSIIEWSKK